jgi:hypothetical protein
MCKLLIKRRKAGTAGATLRLRLLLVVLLLRRRWRKVRGKARRPCQTRRPSDGLYGSSWNHMWRKSVHHWLLLKCKWLLLGLVWRPQRRL